MAFDDHIIMRQVLAIQVASQKDLSQLQRKVRQALEEKLNQLLDQLFSQHVPKDVIITIDRLQVDLGSLNAETLATGLLEQVQKKLPKAISEVVEMAAHKHRVIPLPAAKLKAVQHYLIHGYAAWWMPKDAQNTFEAIYLELINELPEDLKKLWWELKSTPKAIKRFVAQFSPLAIKQTTQLLSRSHSNTITAIAEDLITMQQEHQLGASRTAVFAQTVWVATLLETVSLKHFFNEQAFVQASLTRLAEELNTSYPAFLFTLAKQLERKKSPDKYRSNLPNVVTQLHEALATQVSPDTSQSPLPTLLERFSTLLSSPSAEQLSADLPQLLSAILAKASTSSSQSLLRTHLQDKAFLHKLVRVLPETSLIQLIARLNPSIQAPFKVIQDLCASSPSQSVQSQEGSPKPVEQLTLHYISHHPATHAPNSYATYLLTALSSQFSFSLSMLKETAQQQKPQLLQTHASSAVTLVLEVLTKVAASPDTTDSKGYVDAPDGQGTDTSLDVLSDALLRDLRMALTAGAYAGGSEFRRQRSQLGQVFEEVIHTPKPESKQATLVQAWRGVLATLIQDTAVLSNLITTVQAWVQQVVSEPDSMIRRSLVRHFERRLAPILPPHQSAETSPSLSLDAVRNFFSAGTLPEGYTSLSAFTEVLLDAVLQQGLKAPIITLLQGKAIRENLMAIMPVQRLKALIAALSPLKPTVLATYQTVLFKADILHAATIEEKRRVLDRILLEAISQVPKTTPSQLIQHTLLAISRYSKLPKRELFRRVKLVAEQQEKAVSIVRILESITPTFDVSATEVTDALELKLLPIYQALSQLINPSLLSQYQATLLPALKQAIRQGIAGPSLDVQVARMIETAFQSLEPGKQAKVQALVKTMLRQAVTEQQQLLEEAWKHFLHTGELGDHYATPHVLFEALLTRPSVRAQKIVDDLTQEPHSIKVLVANLDDADLTRLVVLLNEKAQKVVLKYINSVSVLWSYTGTQQVSQQDFRAAWWEATLTNLLGYSAAFQEKAWLTQSLIGLADAIGVERSAMLTSLISATKTVLTSTKEEQRFVKQLKQIQQVWRREVRKKAKQAWPRHTTLRELHKLLELGLSSLGEHKGSALSRLEQALQSVFVEQGADVGTMLLTYPNKELVAQRLVYYFSDDIVQRFVSLLAAQTYPLLQKYLAWASSLRLPSHLCSLDAFTWRKQNEVAVLAYLLQDGSDTFDKEAFIEYYVEKLSKDTGVSQGALKQVMLAQAPKAGDSEVLLLLKELAVADQPDLSQSEEEPPPKEEEQLPQEEIKMYVRNGGIVFLWPFLGQLFEEQELTKEHKFIDRIAVNNAVHVIQYLVTGQLNTPGWRLVLNKLFCGMAYDDVVATEYRPQKEEELPSKELVKPTAEAVEDGQASDEKSTEQPTDLPPEVVHPQQSSEVVEDEASDEKSTGESAEQPTDLSPEVVHPQQSSEVVEDEASDEKSTEESAEQPTDLPPEVVHLQQRSEALLERVMKEWEGLKTLEDFEEYEQGFTLDDFRQYFLRRSCILRRIEGEELSYWHLTLPLAPYDSKRICPPWSIRTIRLPWMKEKIVVFWPIE